MNDLKSHHKSSMTLNGSGQLLRASEITFAYATGQPPTHRTSVGYIALLPG